MLWWVRNALVLAVVVSPALAQAQTPAPCIAAWHDTVQLSGVLRQLTFPGPPNYEDIQNGDAVERGFYLQLREPICTRNDEIGDPQQDVRLVQLLLDSAGYATLRPHLGGRVTLRGTVFGRHTGHHHAAVILEVQRPFVARPGLD